MSKYNKKSTISKKKKTIIVYTDGSCIGNGRKNAVGGIGIHFPNGELKDVSKIYKLGLCTNQKAELYAILTALRYIKQNFNMRDYKIIINTDSQYSIDCITKWVYGWIKNGWRTQNNKPVANQEFIEVLYKYYECYDIIFNHIFSHTNGNDTESLANAIADKLATRATKKAQLEIGHNYTKSDPSKKYTAKKNYGNKTNKDYNSSKTNKNYNGSKTNKNYNSSKNKYQNNKPQNFPYNTNFVVELVKKSK